MPEPLTPKRERVTIELPLEQFNDGARQVIMQKVYDQIMRRPNLEGGTVWIGALGFKWSKRLETDDEHRARERDEAVLEDEMKRERGL